MPKPADQINWDKVRALVDRHELIVRLVNIYRVLPVNDGSHMLAAIIQDLVKELDGIQPIAITSGVIPTP